MRYSCWISEIAFFDSWCSFNWVSCILQPKGKKAKGKKVAPAPSVAKKHDAKKVVNPLFEKRPKNFGIGECPFLLEF